ncbi:MAG TPA: hypothetical protein VFY46_05870 [Acidimicrobiia bacterium]|nr:hypothetical protein [Acidimicrobiia bacterium]
MKELVAGLRGLGVFGDLGVFGVLEAATALVARREARDRRVLGRVFLR